MPRQREVPVNQKTVQTNVVSTKVPSEVRKRFDALSDLSGLSAPELLRHCIHRALPDLEFQIRSGEIPPEPYLVKELKTRPHRLAVPPLRSEIGAPPSLLAIIQEGVFPEDYEPEPVPEWQSEAAISKLAELQVADQEPTPPPRPRRRRRG